MTVVKDTGKRAILPPFGEEHEELRESISRWIKAEIAPNVDEWEEAREFPRELFTRAGELGFLGLKYPTELGGQGGDYVHDAVWAEELALSGASGGVAAGLGAHDRDRDPADLQVRDPRAARALPRPGDHGREDLRARDHRAGRRLRRRLDPRPTRRRSTAATSSTAPRPSSPTASAPTSSSAPSRRPRRAATAGSRSSSWSATCPATRSSRKLEKMGWHSSDTGELSFTDVEVPDENLLGEENGGLQADHGQLPVGAAADGARRRRRHAAPARGQRSPTPRSARRSAARSGTSRRSATRSPRCRSRPRSRGR